MNIFLVVRILKLQLVFNIRNCRQFGAIGWLIASAKIYEASQKASVAEDWQQQFSFFQAMTIGKPIDLTECYC